MWRLLIVLVSEFKRSVKLTGGLAFQLSPTVQAAGRKCFVIVFSCLTETPLLCGRVHRLRHLES